MGADGRNVKSILQSRNISAFVPAWSTVFRESIIESGSAAPSSVVNPADAVQIIGGRPVIGSENIRRHARRKVREPRPPQRLSFPPVLTPQVSRLWWGRPPGLRGSPWTRSCLEESSACHSNFLNSQLLPPISRRNIEGEALRPLRL